MTDDKIIIFTDLDGTLLDHETYSFEAAEPMLGFIRKQKIPLIVVTSKTKEEVLRIQTHINIQAPFIVENGAGIFIPNGETFEMIPMGFEYEFIRSCFDRYATFVSVRGFGDMSDEEVAELTGLTFKNASNARKRTFTEPFLLKDESQLKTLEVMAHRDKLDIVKGGRFYHLITRGQDKANAIRYLIKKYEADSGLRIHTVALGDSANDVTMLRSVDKPVLIPHPDGTYMACDIQGMIKAPFPGPKGWNSVLEEYLHAK